MKFISIFFTASVTIFVVSTNVSDKRARNMKFISIFFTASAENIRGNLKDVNLLKNIFTFADKFGILPSRKPYLYCK